MAGAVKDRPITVFRETHDATLGLSENSLRVLSARYLKKNEAGEVVETPADMFQRVAGTLADVERLYGASPAEREAWEERFFDLMVSGQFMPNSPTLMNAGREMGMLSACFVLPVRDSITDIFDTIKHTALIQKAGGGTGFAFDELRPTGDYIRSSGGTTSGPISFWRAFSEATNAIQQGAFRRGANMGMMYIHHPDILKFLHAKEDLSQFTNYNISVKVTDEWMEDFLCDPDGPHVVRNPRTGQEYVCPRDLAIWKYDLRSLTPVRRGQNGELRVMNGHSGTAASGAGADADVARSSSFESPVYTRRDIWDIIVRNAHRTGEPGVVFIDRINESNPTPHVGRIEATNPCGEQPLLPYEACNLGSVNLGWFISDPCTPRAAVDWDGLRECIQVSTRFLDNVIDANNYPLPEIDKVCKANRKIGLGVMGFADALYKLNVRYSSDEGIAWGERFMKFLNDETHNYSERLARERGCFPNWQGSIWDTKHHRPMRNSAATTVAPTGTISIIAGCSGGIEPLFSLAFFRNVLKGQEKGKKPMVEINPIFETVARERGFYSEGLMDQIAKDGTLAHIAGVPEDVRHVFVCAHDITPEWHVRMQAAFQAHCDASISKTINFPHEATVEDVETIYRLAYSLRCKGVTVYRDGCRLEQPMALKDSDKRGPAGGDDGPVAGQGPTAPPDVGKDEPAKEARTKMTSSDGTIEPRDIPEIVSGLRIRQMTPFGNMHVKITVEPRGGRELEVFAQLGKGGDLANSDLEAICRLISLWLRAGGSLNHVIRQLKDIGSSLQVPTKEGQIKSLGDGLARALMKYRRAKEKFGLRELLLGEYDLSELDQEPGAGPNGNGNGKTNGNGGGNGNSHGRAAEVRHGPAAHGATVEGPAAGVGAGLSHSPRIEFKVKCPSCGEGLVFAEGCNKCYNCGWAQC
ncbi:MAG: adenosylcobalamin-dependent ribonucleoside-diphosphate reductase [Planctomycetes bacterium]|nr:adenosylcobalamin-dependent ribonucleoside-diphosphate reductase [Planctomycetota bacterium]